MYIKKIKTFSFFDVFAYFAVILTALILMLTGTNKQNVDYFTVNCNGQISTYPLNENKSYDFTSNGLNIIVRAENGQVYVASSECPDKYCVHSGRISKPGQIIVCAPGRFSVSTKESGENADAVTG